MEAETTNAGTKLIRDRALQQGGEHMEKVCLVEIEARQRCYPEKKCGRPPLHEKECSKEAFTSFI